MLKQTSTTSILVVIVALLSGTALLLSGITLISMQGCEPEDNPKLTPSLNKLVQAEAWGEVEDFARPGGIELLYDDAGLVSVEVIIECLPGQVEEAAEAAETYGTVGVIYRNMIVVVVPITILTALADEESIEQIRLPEPPEGA